MCPQGGGLNLGRGGSGALVSCRLRIDDPDVADQKHHYIPEFYLKRWTGADHRLVEFCRRYKNRTVPRPTFPGGTGYVRGLYSIQDAPIGVRDILEDKFMMVADGIASASLDVMLNDHVVPSGPNKHGWARFMLSLLYRTPEGVARSIALIRSFKENGKLAGLRDAYDAVRTPADPATPEEYIKQYGERMEGRLLVDHLMRIIESPRVRGLLLGMQWHLGRMDNLKHPLITGDRPIIMTNGLSHPDSHIVMPLSPRHIFIAANTDSEAQRIMRLSRNGELAYRMNDRIARQARKFVYATDATQLRFIDNRLGEKAACSPFE
jgi:hypothetical protein